MNPKSIHEKPIHKLQWKQRIKNQHKSQEIHKQAIHIKLHPHPSYGV